eukprot:6653735-Prymnesium_polylepis.1
MAEDACDYGLRIICVSYLWLEVHLTGISHRLLRALRDTPWATHSACVPVYTAWPPRCIFPMYTQPGHPDPKRFNLDKIAFVLKKYLAKGGRPAAL